MYELEKAYVFRLTLHAAKSALRWTQKRTTLFHVPVSQTLSEVKWDSAFFGLSDVGVIGQMMGL